MQDSSSIYMYVPATYFGTSPSSLHLLDLGLYSFLFINSLLDNYPTDGCTALNTSPTFNMIGSILIMKAMVMICLQ